MGGAVQHGASTLPDDMFDLFPKKGTMEVHLATGFQNIIFDSASFPNRCWIRSMQVWQPSNPNEPQERPDRYSILLSDTQARFRRFQERDPGIYPRPNIDAICAEIEERFSFLLPAIERRCTDKLVAKLIKKVYVQIFIKILRAAFS